MDWNKLMSHKRLKGENDDPNPARTSDLRDMDRIVFSAAFRRMQDKTQVFPLPLSDYVRTRLTHSIESSCVGRSLGALVGKEIIERHKLTNLAPINFGITTAVACLAHDIGNPPFGHSGEDAIQYWFRNSTTARILLDQMTERQQEDLLNFEGNAQGFRILTRIQNYPKPGGLQLTCATLGTFTKYPRESATSTDTKLPEGASTKKNGIFQSEIDLFKEVACETGLIQKSQSPNCWARHPLAFLVEAADDICYRIIDFEDGYKMRRVHFEEIRDQFKEIVTDKNDRLEADEASEESDTIAILRAKAINALIIQVAKVFCENETDLLSGNFDTSLIEIIDSKGALKKIYQRSKELVYTEQSVIDVEAAGFEVIGGLLDTFVSAAIENSDSHKKASAKARKYLELLPKRFKAPERDPYKIALNLAGHISGMTDSYAVALYKKIRGISLPNS